MTGAAALIAGLGLVVVAPGAVANGPGDQVCPGLDSTKIEVDEERDTLTVEAPEGQLIDGYCVKAGSDKQEDGGPEYVTVDPPLESVTISHPNGKNISHYSVSYTTPTTTTTTTPPASTTTTTTTPPASTTTTTTTPPASTTTTTTTPPASTTTTTTTPPASTTTTTTTPPASTTTTTTPPASTTTTTTTPPASTTTTSTPPASTTTTTTPPAGTTTTPATPGASVIASATTQPRVLARTGLEVSTVATVGGLMLLGGGALLALASGTSPRGRRS